MFISVYKLNAMGIKEFFNWVWEKERNVPHFDFRRFIKADAMSALDTFYPKWSGLH
jgi:hypothetical protein